MHGGQARAVTAAPLVPLYGVSMPRKLLRRDTALNAGVWEPHTPPRYTGRLMWTFGFVLSCGLLLY